MERERCYRCKTFVCNADVDSGFGTCKLLCEKHNAAIQVHGNSDACDEFILDETVVKSI